MNHTLRFWFATICSTGAFVAAYSQTQFSGQVDTLPAMREWFLATGSWQNDPALYVREVGNGKEVVIMLHGGWGGEHSGLMDAINGQDERYRFIFYDQRGSLRSPFPDSLITFDHHIDDIERLRLELKLDKLTVVGHSMGAILASAYASKHPQRIQKLILLAPALLKEPLAGEDKKLQHEGYLQAQDYLKRADVHGELERHALNRTTPPLSSQEETARSRIQFGARMLSDIRNWPKLGGGKVFYNPKVYDLTASTYPASGWDYIREFNARSYPVSVIAGDHDFLDFGNRLSTRWVKGSRISLRIINGAGHVLWADQPDMFAKEFSRQLTTDN